MVDSGGRCASTFVFAFLFRCLSFCLADWRLLGGFKRALESQEETIKMYNTYIA